MGVRSGRVSELVRTKNLNYYEIAQKIGGGGGGMVGGVWSGGWSLVAGWGIGCSGVGFGDSRMLNVY